MQLHELVWVLLVSVTKNAWSVYTYWGNSLSLHIDLMYPSIRCGDPIQSLFSVGGILYWDAFCQQSLPRHRP